MGLGEVDGRVREVSVKPWCVRENCDFFVSWVSAHRVLRGGQRCQSVPRVVDVCAWYTHTSFWPKIFPASWHGVDWHSRSWPKGGLDFITARAWLTCTNRHHSFLTAKTVTRLTETRRSERNPFVTAWVRRLVSRVLQEVAFPFILSNFRPTELVVV